MKKTKVTLPPRGENLVNKISGPRYYLVKDRYLLGHFIYDTGEDYSKRSNTDRIELFYHTDAAVAQQAFNDVVNGKFNAKKYAKIQKQKLQLIVKFEEKHGDMYYVYTSREEFYKIFYTVFKERYENDGWYDFDVEKPKQPLNTNNKPLTERDIANVTDGDLRNFQIKRLREYEAALKEYEKSSNEERFAKEILKTKSGKMALLFMEKRRNYEYEQYEIIVPQKYED